MKFIFVLLLSVNLFSQSHPIAMNGKFDDWSTVTKSYIDGINDGVGLDFVSFYVTNDENFLYIKLKVTTEIKLQEIVSDSPTLYIDGDNNSSTGTPTNGIGAELRWNFGTRNGVFYKTSSTNIQFSKIGLRYLPTVTADEYEIAIGRTVKPDNVNSLFTSDTIKIFFKNEKTNGDFMPNSGQTFTFVFDPTPVPAYVPIDMTRADTSYLRVMNYNIEFDALLNPAKQPAYTRILNAIKPDIICFNEFFNSTAEQVRVAINQMLPLPGGASWYAIKLDAGNVTVSKYPFKQHWYFYPGQRMTASLVNLSSRFANDILLINSHLRCCTADADRQREVDAMVAFLLDAKSPGGVITLADKTPFMVLGDMNFVGFNQQLKTIMHGNIINTSTFGAGAPPDWDTTSLEDLHSYQTDKNTVYTWRSDNSSYVPGRLDFMIYSNSVMRIEKSFVLQTEIMPANRLLLYGLNQTDTRSASDHFPKVADITFNLPTGILNEAELPKQFQLEQNYPNPFNPSTVISWQSPVGGWQTLKVYDLLGREVAVLVNEEKPAGKHSVTFDASSFTSGVYFYRLSVGEFVSAKKLILMK